MKFKKPLHLIIEGSDKVGKSTVCELLSKKLNLPVIKMTGMKEYFKKNPEEASELFNKTVVQFSHTSFICDRGFPSSLVYSVYFHRTYDLRYLTDIIRKLDARIYVLSVYPREADGLISQSEQTGLNVLYRVFADKYKWTIIDCENLTPEQICQKILISLVAESLV